MPGPGHDGGMAGLDRLHSDRSSSGPRGRTGHGSRSEGTGSGSPRGRTSSGLLVHRWATGAPGPGPAGTTVEVADALQVLIVHPGGPFWARRDDGAWSIPKGEPGSGEDPAQAAAREFREELGLDPPAGPWTDLGEVRQAGGKRVRAWAVPGDLDVSAVRSGTFELRWPPRSGRVQAFPEVDRAAWVSPEEARRLLVPAQAAFVDRLVDILRTGSTTESADLSP